MAVRYGTPRAASDKTKIYRKFKGADFSTDGAKIDDAHSPMPLNLISDDGGYPEKRPGWESVAQFSGRINGIFTFLKGQTEFRLIHAGTVLYRLDGTSQTPLKTGIEDGRSCGFVQNEKLWILTGAQYLVFDGETVQDVSGAAYVPTTVISRDPSGGGVMFEAVNLIGKKRKNSFLADGTSAVYQLDAAPIDEDALRVVVNGSEKTEGTDYTVDRTNGTVTFSAAPKKPQDAGGVEGADNVEITFSRTVEGYAQRIEGCTICTQYGKGTTDRVFFSGNPQYRNMDWHSGYRDPSYVPDTSYSLIGGEETAVMGYLPFGSQLAVIKEDNQQDSTIFLRSCVNDENGDAKFPIEQGVNSVGAISKYCFASLRDDPVFLSASGVNAISTNAVTYERSVRRRSGFVDARLTKEPDLSQAVAAVWGNWYVLAVNGRCYVADANQKSYRSNISDAFLYEWYYWDNVPARVLDEHAGELWFGTEDGRICRFKSGSDMSVYSDDGEAITAQWATKEDDDDDFMRYKTMIRRGSGVMAKPYVQSRVKIAVVTDSSFENVVRERENGIFDWSDLDFAHFTFNTFDGPRIIPINRKVRKYKRMQLIIRNENVNQGFGIYGIIKRYRFGGYVK